MKKKLVKRFLATAVTAVLALGCLTGCGGSKDSGGEKAASGGDTQGGPQGGSEDAGDEQGGTAPAEGGTIMWLSNLSSGLQYDNAVKYAEMICKELGYKFTVVYGDSFNDPAGNLNAVKNGMTKDVVALIASQDGGIQNIMDEYPDLYVAGYNTDMAAVYGENGAAKAVLGNEKFLGCICDGFSNGKDTGKAYFDAVVEQGYKKVALVMFPSYAYPQLEVAANTFRELVEEYNQTASDGDKIEIVGENKVLEFAPLDESYFLEEGNGDLDAIVAACAGTDFVYPTMKSAMGNGACSKDTKLLTSGFNDDEAIIADIGGDGVIQYLAFSPVENMLYAFAVIDNALQGKQYADLDAKQIVDSLKYQIDSKEDIDNVMTKAFNGSGDLAQLQISWEDSKNLFTRYNESAAYADLLKALQSQQLTVEALAE